MGEAAEAGVVDSYVLCLLSHSGWGSLSPGYLNLRILLFGSILLTSTPSERASIPQSAEAIQKCLDAAKQTIQVIYQVYQHHDFFHTW